MSILFYIYMMSDIVILVSVVNQSNDHCHFKREIWWNSNVSFPYDKVASTLLLLFKGLKIKVLFDIQEYVKK